MIDNFAPTYGNSGTVNIDDLIYNDTQIVSRSVVLKLGQANLKRGTLLGRIVADTFTPTAQKPLAGGANTGNATIGAITGGTLVNAGTYVILFTGATTFTVFDMDGEAIGPDGATGTAFVSNHINFTITAGGTAMVAGDGWLIAVTGSGKYVKCVTTNIDGSGVPSSILAQDTDATAADTTTVVYEHGTFNENVINSNSDASIANPINDRVRILLRRLGIYLKIAYQGT